MREAEDPTLAGESWREPAWDVLEIIRSSSADGTTIRDRPASSSMPTMPLLVCPDSLPGEEMQHASIEGIIERFELLDEDGNPLAVDELPGRRAISVVPARAFPESNDCFDIPPDSASNFGMTLLSQPWSRPASNIPSVSIKSESSGWRYPPDAIADRIKGAVSGLDDRRTDDVAVLVLRC
jgi:hypothetical protein